MATARTSKIEIYAQTITDLQDALFHAKGKFQSDVCAGSHFYLKTMHMKYIDAYIKPSCMFPKGAGIYACSVELGVEGYLPPASGGSVLEESDICRGRGSKRDLASSVMILQE